MTAAVAVREATPDDLPAVLNVLDAAALETDAHRVRGGIDRGDVLVAVPRRGSVHGGDGSDGPERPPVGALVLAGDEIANVAVRRRRRGQGIGTALVEAAADRRDRLVVEFDEGVRPFYEALGFEISRIDATDDRYRGVLPRD